MKKALLFGCALTGLSLVPNVAEAFSVKVHIHMANEIRDELVRNMNAEGCTEGTDPWCGLPAIRLLGPDDSQPNFVLLDRENAEAIRDFPEFWRGGAIGPDNTVFPGMTDPSHGWQFAPFSQCDALLQNAEAPEERAYALGCFLHGITDNNAHHLVNFFAGETFTLFPKAAAEGGELEFSLINVVRHITVEGKFEKALQNARPEDFVGSKMRHRIAKDLYKRVYLDPHDEGRGLWHWFAGRLVARKNDALRAAQLDGFDPNEHLELTIEEIKESGVTIDLDGRIMQAYVDFLQTGGGVDILEPHGLAPADYILLLPELVEDTRRLLAISEARGVDRMNEIIDEWKAEGECSILCPILKTKKRLYENIFAPDTNGGKSKFQRAVEQKNRELDGVVDGYLGTVERLSNLVVTKGIGGMGPSDLEFAFEPLGEAIDSVVDFPYEALFPEWAVDVIQSVAPLRDFLEGVFDLVTRRFKEEIKERARVYLDELREQLLALAPDALLHIREQVNAILEHAKSELDEAKLEALGLDLSDGEALFDSFATSVLYMNSYNSIAGVLANHEVVFISGPSSFFASPVSFDASFQVGYNQLNLCDDLSEVFYPCGLSATELLQPDVTTCERLPDSVKANPPAECHDGSAVAFDADPNPATCVRRELDDIVGFQEGHLGSYTLAYPPELASDTPMCVNPVIRGINEDNPFDQVDTDSAGEGEGCACRNDTSAAPSWALLFAVGWIVRRRRRRLIA